METAEVERTLCLDLENPGALLISSNAKNAFSETDPEVMAFIRFIGELVRYDLFESDFVHQICELRPQLFSAHPTLMISRVEEIAMAEPATAAVPLPLMPGEQ